MSTNEYYKICDHAYTIKHCVWKTCLTCGMCLKRCLSYEENSSSDRIFVENKGPDYVAEIRKKMRELMNIVVRKFCKDKHTDKVLYTDPPEVGLPYEFYECLEELCQVCNEYKLPDGHLWKEVKRGSPIRCQTRSLCAAVLWEKIKSL